MRGSRAEIQQVSDLDVAAAREGCGPPPRGRGLILPGRGWAGGGGCPAPGVRAGPRTSSGSGSKHSLGSNLARNLKYLYKVQREGLVFWGQEGFCHLFSQVLAQKTFLVNK